MPVRLQHSRVLHASGQAGKRFQGPAWAEQQSWRGQGAWPYAVPTMRAAPPAAAAKRTGGARWQPPPTHSVANKGSLSSSGRLPPKAQPLRSMASSRLKAPGVLNQAAGSCAPAPNLGLRERNNLCSAGKPPAHSAGSVPARGASKPEWRCGGGSEQRGQQWLGECCAGGSTCTGGGRCTTHHPPTLWCSSYLPGRSLPDPERAGLERPRGRPSTQTGPP